MVHVYVYFISLLFCSLEWNRWARSGPYPTGRVVGGTEAGLQNFFDPHTLTWLAWCWYRVQFALMFVGGYNYSFLCIRGNMFPKKSKIPIQAGIEKYFNAECFNFWHFQAWPLIASYFWFRSVTEVCSEFILKGHKQLECLKVIW